MAENTPPSDAQVHDLRDAISTLMRVFKIAEGAAPGSDVGKLSPAEAETLIFVQSHPRCAARDVAEHLAVVPTTCSTILNRLVQRGLILRERTEENRRVVQLSATQAGRASVAAILRDQADNARSMLTALDDEERGAFLEAIKRIAASVS